MVPLIPALLAVVGAQDACLAEMPCGTVGEALVQATAGQLQRAVTADEGAADEVKVASSARSMAGVMAGMRQTARGTASPEEAAASARLELLQDAAAADANSQRTWDRYHEEIAQRGVLALLRMVHGDLHQDSASPAGMAALVILLLLFIGALAMLMLLNVPSSKQGTLLADPGQQPLASRSFGLDASTDRRSAGNAREPSARELPRTAKPLPDRMSDAGRSFASQHSHHSFVSQSSLDRPGSGRHFCPELVVPQGHEAVLAIPVDQSRAFEVKDLEGKPVIRVEMRPRANGSEPVATLLSIAGPGQQAKVLGRVQLVQASGSVRQSSVDVFNARNERYASVSKATNPSLLQRLAPGRAGLGGTCYLLTPQGAGAGSYLVLSGNFQDNAVNIMNERQEQLADTEPQAVPFDRQLAYFKLRVVSNGDVGLMLCALLGIGVLERKL